MHRTLFNTPVLKYFFGDYPYFF